MGIAVSVDCILKIKHIAPGIFNILEVVLLMAFAVMLSYFTELLLGYQMKLHSMRDASMEHDMLMEQMNHQLIEKQNAQIYNVHAKGEKPYRKRDTRQRGSHDYALYFAGGSNRCDKYR